MVQFEGVVPKAAPGFVMLTPTRPELTVGEFTMNCVVKVLFRPVT